MTQRVSSVEKAMIQLAETLRSLEIVRTADERRHAEEMRELSREWNHERGEIARKMGTLVEDMLAPSISSVIAAVFHLADQDPLEHFAIRVKRRVDGVRREFDAVAAWPGYLLINETKSNLEPGDVPDLIQRLLGARRFFPEYADRRLVGALTTLYPDPSLVRYGERKGLIVIGLGDRLMEAKNSSGFRPAEF